MKKEDLKVKLDLIKKNSPTIEMAPSEKKDVDKLVLDIAKHLAIDPSKIYVYYERFTTKESILAIKKHSGIVNNSKDYVIFACRPEFYNNEVYCDIEMYAASGKQGFELSSKIGSAVCSFFQTREESLLIKEKLKFNGFQKIIKRFAQKN